MKISIASDLHLEFNTVILDNVDNSDVLILAGDICVVADYAGGRDIYRYDEFFAHVSKEFKDVIYVLGNHEYYRGDWSFSENDLRACLAKFPNIHVLEKETLVIDGVTFIGGTLWTDFNREDPMTLHAISDLMNDYRMVKNSDKPTEFIDGNGFRQLRAGKFKPEDALEDHYKMKQYVEHVVGNRSEGDRFVLVTHFSPSHLSIHDMYKHDYLMNGGFHSELTEWIMDRPSIELVVHGHTHSEFDYKIDGTRVICNPHGYPSERWNEYKLKTVEL